MFPSPPQTFLATFKLLLFFLISWCCSGRWTMIASTIWTLQMFLKFIYSIQLLPSVLLVPSVHFLQAFQVGQDIHHLQGLLVDQKSQVCLKLQALQVLPKMWIRRYNRFLKSNRLSIGSWFSGGSLNWRSFLDNSWFSRWSLLS